MRKQRAGLHARRHGDEPPGFLRRASVTPISARSYEAMLLAFTLWAKPRRHPLVMAGPWDFAIDLCMGMLYRSGDAPSVGRRLIAVAAWMMVFNSRVPTIRQLSRKAKRGGMRLAPDHARDPCPVAA
eukprot:7363695-Heterocapsa_arctica.AAC.1